MISWLIIFALIAMIVYYAYSAFKTVKNFIEKKRAQKVASKINDALHNVADVDEQTHGD